MKRLLRLGLLLGAVLLACAAGAQSPSTAAPGEEHAAEAQPPSTGGGHEGHQQPGEASGEAAESEHDEHAAFKYSRSVQLIARMTGLSLTGAYWLAVVFNFLVIAVVVGWLWRGHAPQAFRARTASIQKDMAEARLASQEATERLTEVERRLAHLDSEIASLTSSAESEAAAEEARILAAVEQDRRKVVEDAAQEIEALSRQAQRELKAYAAELAVSLAEKRIQVEPAADRALVGNFVEQLSGNPRGA